MSSASGDVALTVGELRVVARYAVDGARDVLAVFEEVCPGDGRPRAAVEAARAFAGGAVRSTWQRVAALEAHRAAGAAAEETSAMPVVRREMRSRRPGA
ncbi:putative immunity protein [Actinopolyspora mortivallis]|uniref:putative immunity protein n=1 Tax=Actinopolyspora mortivallis TaxID=33906 RepID=UPI0012EDC2E0|nr:hypothetical protein [Actinopolyspora mortivallis]